MTAYGAVVGTIALVVAVASLGWQVFTWFKARAETSVVDIGPVVLPQGPAVQIEVRNPSSQPISVVGAALTVSGGAHGLSVIHLVPGPAGATIPGAIGPNASGRTWVLLHELPLIAQFGWSVTADILVAHRQAPLTSRRMAWVATNGGQWEYTN